MEVSCAAACSRAREVLDRPARPHLASTGLEDFSHREGPPEAAGLRSRRGAGRPGRRAPGRRPDATLAFAARGPGLPRHHRRGVHGPPAIPWPWAPELERRPARAREAGGRAPGVVEATTGDARSCAWSVPDRKATALRRLSLHLYTLRSSTAAPAPRSDGGPGLNARRRPTWASRSGSRRSASPTMPLHARESAGDGPGTDRHYSPWSLPRRADQEDVGLPGSGSRDDLPWGRGGLILKYRGARDLGRPLPPPDPAADPHRRLTSTTVRRLPVHRGPRGVPPLPAGGAPRRRRGVRPARGISG